MLKRMMRIAAVVMLMISQCANAATGALFNVTATGTPGDVNITLCLNGLGALSCQNYTVSALTVTISPTVPNHVYPNIGIKINTPGYTLGNLGLNCAPNSNGYCLFSVSQSQPKTLTLEVLSRTTITALSSSLNPSIYSQPVTFTAAVSPNNATGMVTFTDGGATIGSGTLSHGSATYITSSLAGGDHSIVATYSGDSHFDASTSNTVSQTVDQATQTISFTSTAPTNAFADASTYSPTATSTSGLSVTITVDSSSNSVCSISGGVVSFIAPGICTLNANQTGNADFSAAAEVQQAVTVHAETPTTTVVYSSLNPSVKNNSVTFSANVSSDNGTPSTGTVGFTANGTNISGCIAQPLTSGIATCTTSSFSTVATDSIIATYAGGSGFAASTSVPFSQSVVTSQNFLNPRITVPAAPQFVSTLPGDDQVTIKWFPPANTGGSVITGYTVTYGTTSSTTYTTPGCTTTSNLQCVVNGLTDGTPYTFTVAAINSKGTGLTAFSSSVTPGAILTTSPSNLALSGLGSGASRSTTITNNSITDITIDSVSNPSPALPSGSIVNISQINACTSGMTLTANGGFCTITITPASTATSTCTTGTAPTPSVITVTDNNADTTTVNVVILGYGCQYQEGYLFSIDDTTPLTSSIGGKVVTLSDQSGVTVWSNQLSGIGGTSDASTIANPSPSPPPQQNVPIGQLNCNAANDGSCATNNLYVTYGTDSYAADFCKSTINGYTDWYLPSVCEFGPFGSTGLNTGNYPSLTNSQTCINGSANIQDQLVSTNIVTNFTTGKYWCSTEDSNTAGNAWIQSLDLNGGNQTSNAHTAHGVAGARCSRTLTL